jgi:hypothetical protein
VKRDGHHFVRELKSLLHTVAVMQIQIDVKNSIELLSQLRNAQNNVVYIAEAARVFSNRKLKIEQQRS